MTEDEEKQKWGVLNCVSAEEDGEWPQKLARKGKFGVLTLCKCVQIVSRYERNRDADCYRYRVDGSYFLYRRAPLPRMEHADLQCTGIPLCGSHCQK